MNEITLGELWKEIGLVKVIYCKDCRHWDIENKPNRESDYCLCECYCAYKKPSGFCDYAERKTEDE